MNLPLSTPFHMYHCALTSLAELDTIISNVYIKIPDSSVSLQAILSEVAGKVGEPLT